MEIPQEKAESLSFSNHLTLVTYPSGEKSFSTTNLDKTARVILVGDSGVGKSSILMRYVQDIFKEKFPATAGVEIAMKPIHVEGEDIKLQIWDTAGQERYRTVTKSFYKQALGAFLVFDLTSRESFKKLNDWIVLLDENAPSDVSITILGNKYDMKKERMVSNDEIEEFVAEKQLNYYETSAKTNKNIEEAFLDIAKRIKKKKFDNKSEEIDIRKSMRLSSSGEAGSPNLRMRQKEEKGEKCC